MEEAAWGQHLLGFETPATLRDLNAQDEVTAHNIRGLQGHSEFFRLAFGLGGLIGVFLVSRNAFRMIGPPALLFPWFIVISVASGLDLFIDFLPVQSHFDTFINHLSEVVELMIGISALLFISLNKKMLAAEYDRQRSSVSKWAGTARRPGRPATGSWPTR